MSLRVSRRQALKMGVGVAVVAASTAAYVDVFTADMARSGRDELNALGFGPVTAIEGRKVTVVVREAADDHRRVVGQALSASLLGFSEGISPRIGDMVMVTAKQNKDLHAMPICTTRTGVPQIDSSSRLSIGEFVLVGSQATKLAAESGKTVRVTMLDSTLADRQVLAVRPG